MRGESRTRAIGIAVTVASLAAIGLLTLLPSRSPQQQLECCTTTDSLLNVILFIPLGIGLALMGFSGLGAAIIGAALSGGIELSQVWLIAGRDGSIHDVVSNCIGTGAGALIVHHWAIRRAWWRWIGGGLTSVFLLLALLGPSLVVPVYPLRETWYSQWQHDFRGMATFQGKVLSFQLQDTNLPDGEVANSRNLRSALVTSDSVIAKLRFESGPPVDGRAQLAGLVAGWPGPWILHFVQEQTDLLVRARLRMSDLGFASPVFRLPSLLPATAGDTVGITLSVSRKAVHLTETGSRSSDFRFPLSTDLVWVAFLPLRELQPSTAPWIRGAAALLALFVLGVGAPRSKGLQALGVLCWLVSGPVLFGLSLAGPVVVGFGLVGLILGTRVGRALGLA